MFTLNAAELAPAQLYGYLNHVVAPRPICFASTINLKGEVNLSPFSFFNLMSTNPPVCVFSPVSNRNNEPKHTLLNVQEVPEVVINIVNYPMVQQMNLTSGEYDREVNEFTKSGFTPLASALVKPPRVAESPVQIECTVTQIINLGSEANAGNLVIAEVKLVHIHESMMGADGKIDQARLDLVARLGGDWYCRVTEDNLFKVARPVLSIGVDGLPAQIRRSDVLTGNDLGILGNTEHPPAAAAITAFGQRDEVNALLQQNDVMAWHNYIQQLLIAGRVEDARLAAWCKVAG
jgi:flavin reductase (DIM6/NTAB) family NADH-FMN oxidoreductase RutF